MNQLFWKAGQHVLLDLSGVAADKLCDAAAFDRMLRAACSKGGAQVIDSLFHSFGPGSGLTGILLLAESHASVHTWRERGYAAFDFFTCGASYPEEAAKAVIADLEPRWYSMRVVERGANDA